MVRLFEIVGLAVLGEAEEIILGAGVEEEEDGVEVAVTTIRHPLTTILVPNRLHPVPLLVVKDGDQVSGLERSEELLQDIWLGIEDNKGLLVLEHISLERFGVGTIMERGLRGMVDWGERGRLALRGRLSLLHGIRARDSDRPVGGESNSMWLSLLRL